MILVRETSNPEATLTVASTDHLIATGFYLLARRGRNERVNTAEETGLPRLAAEAVRLTCVSLFVPPKPGSSTRLTGCPVKRSIARIESSSTGVTIVIARP